MHVFSPTEISQSLQSTPEWKLENENLTRQFSFPDFQAAMRFVNSVAALAEQAQHHPDIDIRYNKVTLALASHDAGGITELDFRLVGEISKIQ